MLKDRQDTDCIEDFRQGISSSFRGHRHGLSENFVLKISIRLFHTVFVGVGPPLIKNFS